MGGDGGVIASDRRYMRGAGQADSTGDSKRASKAELAEAEREAQIQAMSTCAITGANLDYDDVVVCPFGRLYNREDAVKALLRRKTNGGDPKDNTGKEIGWQVRGLKDLHPVRFQLIKKDLKGDGNVVPICPITSVELNGIQPAYVIVKSKGKTDKSYNDHEGKGPNVLSEKAIKEIGIDALQEEYGPFQKDDLIRLVPSSVALVEIETKLKAKREMGKASKTKKRKKDETNSIESEDGTKRRISADMKPSDTATK